MRRVKILISCAGVDYSVNAGEITELPEAIANDLVKHGLAEYENINRANKDDAIKSSRGKKLAKAV